LDVGAPGLDLDRVVLEREHPTAEVADTGGEPDGRVAARAPELEHLAVGLRRDEGEEELAGRAGHLASPLLARDVAGPFVGVLRLKAGEHRADAIVKHERGPAQLL